MSYDYTDSISLQKELTAIPQYLSEPKSGRSGCKEPSTSSPTSSSPKSSTKSKYDPDHYHGSIEPWDLIAAHELYFVSGNIIKYVVRAGKKDGESDLDDLIKAQVYLKKLIEIRSHQ